MERDFKKPTVHSMKRRCRAHDYSWKGCYHITISVAKGLHQPLGRMAGRLDKPDSDNDGPHVELTPIGRMVEQELRESIHRYYPMLEVVEYVVMPEHLHFLLVAHSNVVSQSGKATHLGHVIAGFKLGCNKRYWAITGKIDQGEGLAEESLATESPGTLTSNNAGAPSVPSSNNAGAPNNNSARAANSNNTGTLKNDSALGDSVVKHAASGGALPPLFDAGYCDVMPVDEEQLTTQRAYIRANPRNRLMRMANREWLFPQRNTVDTAVSIPALKGYLQRECPQQLNDDIFAAIEMRLLKNNGHVACDSYGNLSLLNRRLLPVVCHRKDAGLFEKQKARCLAEAASGAVLVSARIARGEQEILDQALLCGYAVIRIEDNGFPDIYHPSADRMDDCAAGNLLLLTPWSFQFMTQEENITVSFCKTMNCISQAICKLKDSWWKDE